MEVPFQARACSAGCPPSACPRVDASGISQVFRRSFLCLCSVPGPRSNRPLLASDGYVDAAPAIRTAKASAMADFGANPQLRHLLTYASRVALPSNVQGLLPAGWLAFAGRASNPLDRYERVQFVRRSSPFPALLTLPDFAAFNPGYALRATVHQEHSDHTGRHADERERRQALVEQDPAHAGRGGGRE